MTATTGKLLSVGARHATFFSLNTAGLPAGVDDTAYEGVQADVFKGLTLNIPEPRRFNHPGNDRVVAADFLPSLEAVSGELRTGQTNQPLAALLANVKHYAIGAAGETKGMSFFTNQQGSEPMVGLLVYQQALDTASGLRTWRSIIVPRLRAIVMPGGMSDNPEDTRFALAATICTKQLWGEALSDATHGATEQQFGEFMSQYKPKLVAFKGDGTEDTFLLPTAFPAVSAAKVIVFVNGTEVVSPAITPSTTQVVFASAPADLADIDVFYEYA